MIYYRYKEEQPPTRWVDLIWDRNCHLIARSKFRGGFFYVRLVTDQI